MRILLSIITILLSIESCLICSVWAEEKNEPKYPNSHYYKQFQEVFERIERDYVQEPNIQEMTDEAISGMLRSLDPFSEYYTGEDLEFFLDQTDGEFGGIGVEVVYDRGAIKIVSPIDDLPAFKAGISAGDFILGVNGKLVSNLGYLKSIREMRGQKGTKLNLLVLKEDETTPKEMELTRDTVKIDPIKYELEEDANGYIAYIRIVTFNSSAHSELKKAMKNAEDKAKKKKKKINGIILDVRNNPGGLLDQAAEIVEYFIESGPIVYAKGREEKNDIVLTASKYSAKAPSVPLVVLINSGSASASEILAGALQDHKRAIILGTTSFGKGLVQTFTHVNKRAAVKLTTQKYYTPNGRSINAKGITPDVYIKQTKVEYTEEEDETNKKFNSSSVKSYLKKYNQDEDISKDNDDKGKIEQPIISKKYKTDYQYARAVDLIKGLIIERNATAK